MTHFLDFHNHLTTIVRAAYFCMSSIGNCLRSSEVNGVRHDVFRITASTLSVTLICHRDAVSSAASDAIFVRVEGSGYVSISSDTAFQLWIDADLAACLFSGVIRYVARMMGAGLLMTVTPFNWGGKSNAGSDISDSIVSLSGHLTLTRAFVSELVMLCGCRIAHGWRGWARA